jgi:N6-adenosine-specific RNA methylase IME4
MTTSWRTWLRIHPAAEAFPRLDADALRILANDIKQHGQKEPCTYIKNEAGLLLLDGITRLDARELAELRIDINDRAVFEQLSSDIDAFAYVVSKNLRRRHLDESQRAMVATKLATLRDGQRSDLVQGLPIGRASQLLSVGERSIARAREVQERGVPELQQAVERGRVSVSAAADIATAPIEQQREIVARGEREILEAAKAIRARRAEQSYAERIEKLAQIAVGNRALPTGQRFPVVLADPPWHFEAYNEISGVERAAGNHYPTMSLDEICALPVKGLATDSAALFLWTTAPHLHEAIRLIDAWGFGYRTNICWVKDKIGLGYWVRNQHELLLIATRGDMPAPAPSRRPPSVLQIPKREHSRKPDEAYALIERIYPELPKIELFARGEARPGWAVWGNEAPSAAALAGAQP